MIITQLAELEHYISIENIKDYFTKQCKLHPKLIDWHSREKVFSRISKHIHRWASKAIANFTDTALRMKQIKL